MAMTLYQVKKNSWAANLIKKSEPLNFENNCSLKIWKRNLLPVSGPYFFPCRLINFTVAQPLWSLVCGGMVFCYQNCSDLLWEKIVLVIEKNFWNSRLNLFMITYFWGTLNFSFCFFSKMKQKQKNKNEAT